jgi:hypothetical protein
VHARVRVADRRHRKHDFLDPLALAAVKAPGYGPALTTPCWSESLFGWLDSQDTSDDFGCHFAVTLRVCEPGLQ